MIRIAMLIVLACVGVAQLRTAAFSVKCCCPNPTACKCPDHASHSKQSQLRACHRSSEITVSVDAPLIDPPHVLPIAIVPGVTVLVPPPLARPIAAPVLARDYGPS